MKANKFIICFAESKALADSLSQKTGFPLYELEVIKYSFGEFSVKLPEVPLDADVFFVIQNSGYPSDLIVKSLMALDALQNYKPKRVNLIIPYLPFSRQDRQKGDNRALASRVLGELFGSSFISNIYTFDLHNDVITKHFHAPVYNLTMLDSFVNYFRSLNLTDVVIVAPDHGRFNAAKYVASAFKDAEFVLIHKMREDDGQVHIQGIEGPTEGKTALIIEDIIDTGTTLLSAVSALKQKGVKHIYVAATHAVFSGQAINKIMGLNLEKIIVTNTIPQDIVLPNLVILPIEDYLLPILKD